MKITINPIKHTFRPFSLTLHVETTIDAQDLYDVTDYLTTRGGQVERKVGELLKDALIAAS